MRRGILCAATVLLYAAISTSIGIAGRALAAKSSPRFATADTAVVVRFHQHYAPYFRHLFGCPMTATEAAECRPATGWQDTEEWRQARELAKTVFQLQDPR